MRSDNETFFFKLLNCSKIYIELNLQQIFELVMKYRNRTDY